MNDAENEIPASENPDSVGDASLSKPREAAAGLEAVGVALSHILKEAGVVRGMKVLANLNQKDGFTCPSCAWPDPDDERSGLAEYCENGAKAVADEATLKKIGGDFFAAHPVAELSRLSDHEIGKLGRIAEPLFLEKGSAHYHSVSWDFAFEKMTRHLRALDSPHEAIFYTSGRTSNEAAFLYQLFVRQFGTNNLPDCSNMCHESSGVALTESLGIGKGSVTLEDFYHAEVIMIMGQNPGTNHPRMLSALKKAKKNGAKIIAVNPLPEAGLMAFKDPQSAKGLLGIETKLSDLFLQVALNGDMALLQAMQHLLLLEDDRHPGVVDHDFIGRYTAGFETFSSHIRSCDLNELLAVSGIALPQLQEAVGLLKNKTRIIVCWAMGLTQHVNAVDTIKEVVNLLLLKGSIGKPGAGTCPVRGHSNVQGDRTMGINEKPAPAFLDNLETRFGFSAPRKHGYDVVESICAMHERKARVFFAMGGNFLSATPDTLYTAAALRNCALTVHVSTKLNRSHLVHGEEALILPCLSRSDKDIRAGEEQFVSCENSMGVVQMSKGVVPPVSDRLLSEVDIVCKLALAFFGPAGPVPWESFGRHNDNIREVIESVVPGFGQYNKRVRQPGGFYLPNSNRNGKFDTPGGKALFNIAAVNAPLQEKGRLMMMTIRSHDQFNTTVYGLDDRYRGVYGGRRVILMNRHDIDALGFHPGDKVDIISDSDGTRRVARNFMVVEYAVSRGCAATYFPETNVLVPIGSVALKSNTPVSKRVPVTLERAQVEKRV